MIRFLPGLFKSIRGKLILIISVLLIPAVFVQGYLYYKDLHTRHARELDHNGEMAQAFGRAFNNYINDVIHQESAIGLAVGSADFTAEKRDRFLDENKKLYSALFDLMWVDPEGTVVASHFHQMIGRNLKQRHYVQAVLAGKDLTVSNLYHTACAAKPVFAVSRAVRDKHGQLLGIVSAVIVPDRLRAALGIGRKNGTKVCLIDGNGMLVYSDPQIGTSWKERDWARVVDSMRKAVESGEAARIVALGPWCGKSKCIAATPLRSFGWFAAAYKDELQTPGSAGNLLPEGAAILLIALVAFGSALGLSHNVSKSMHNLRTHCQAVGRGQTRKPLALFGITELDEMAMAFNRMSEQIEAREKEVKEAAEALRESEQRLATILQTASEGFCLIDNEGVIVDLNARMCAILGRKQEEVVGGRIRRFLSGKNAAIFEEQMKLRVQAEAGTQEFEVCRPDGSVVICQASPTPLFDPSGNKVGSFAMVSDISERKRGAEALRKREALFRAIVENSHDAIHFADEKGTMIYRGPSWPAISGYDDSERLGQDTFELLHPDDVAAARQAWAEMLAHAGGRRRFQHRFRHKNGTWSWVEASAHNLLEDPDIHAVVVTARGITDYRQSEEALRASEQRLRLFVEHAPAALAMLDGKMRYLAFSRRWLSNHDLGERDVTGLSHYDVFPEIPERWKQIHRRALSGEVLKADIDLFERADGSVSRIRWEVRPWHYAKGEVAGILIFSEDVTELTQRAEELRIANRALKALSNTFQAIIRATDEPGLLHSVCRIIVEECGYPMGWIGFAEDDENKTVKPVAHAGFEDNYLESVKITWSDTEPGRGPTGTAIRTGVPNVCSNILTEPRMLPWRDEATSRGYGCSAALPLNTGGRTLGALTIYSIEPDTFSETEIKLLAELAENLAYGVADLRLRHAHRVSEKNLQENRARLDLALRSASMGAWHWDIVGNKRHYDEQTCSLAGIDPKTFTGKEEEFLRVMCPENIERHIRALFKTFETDAPYTPEYRMIGADGEVRSLAVRGKLVRDDTGRPIRMDGLIWDITETKRAEEQIRAGRLMLRNVIDGIGSQLVLLDRYGVIKMLNKAALDYLGLQEDSEAIGRPCFEVFYGRSARCEFCEFPIGNLGGNDPVTFERKGGPGADRFEQVAVYGLTSEAGEPDGAIVRITDITQQKLMQEQLIQSEKLASLGLLVAGIAHEINNPNSFILFNLPILKDYLDRIMPIIDDHVSTHPELEFFGMHYMEFRRDIYDLLKNMEHGSTRINGTVSTLKSFVRKRNKLALRQIRLKKVIKQAAAMCGEEIRKNVKSFDVDICESVEKIMADEEAMEQILINLLMNAAHAADKDDSRIGLRVAKQDRWPGMCIIEISDNGCGMDQKTLEKIFDPFFTTKLSTGTGLGLYICKSLVEGLGGRIEVESTPGKGSVFRVIVTQAPPGVSDSLPVGRKTAPRADV